MPPKKKKINFNDDIGAFGDMLEKMTLDDQTIRSTINAAKNGSVGRISMLGNFFPRLPAACVADATTALCAVLDVPAFPPEQPLSLSLSSSREQALNSLLAIAQIPSDVLSDQQSPSLLILEENWPMMCNWMQHFHHDLTTFPHSVSSDPTKDLLPTVVTSVVPTILSNFSCREEVFTRLTMKDDRLMILLVKIWLTTEKFLPDPSLLASHRYQCCGVLHNGLTILDKYYPSGMRLATMLQNIIHEVRGDVDVVTKKLLQQLRNPGKTCVESSGLVTLSLRILYYLVYERLDEDLTSKFMDSYLKNDLVPLASHLLSFVSEDLAKTLGRRVLSKESSPEIIECIFRLLLRSTQSKKGPHWVTVIFKLGFLPNVARILSFDRCLEGVSNDILTMIIGTAIPIYLCHRFVVVSAIKAVKEIVVSGDVAKLEASTLRESWKDFTNTLLERTVMNTIYERDWITYDVRKCENCKKEKQEASLFKCAGCKSTTYCSKECQKTSWKTGGHRSECMKAQDLWYCTGMNMSPGALTFLNFVAITELRRHMPGVSEQLASGKNPSGIPLKDAFFSVSLTNFPATITVRAGDDSSNILNDSEQVEGQPDDAFREFEQIFGDQGDDLPPAFEVCHPRGGRKAVALVQPMSPCIQLFAPGKKYAGDAEIDDSYLLHRKPAKDETGKNLAFVLDEVDRHVMDARKHFRPPAAGDDESPKTIYDYVEMKVAADPDVLVWVGFEVD